MKKKSLVLILICVLLIAAPFIISKNGAFEGADAQVEDKITEIDENYEPWFESFWTPPSSEVESFLFALQAAAGAGFIGYYIGRKKKDVKADNSLCQS